MSMMWRLVLLAGWAAAQSNYADQANSIEFPNEGLPDSTVLDGKVTKLDDLAPVIFLNRTKAALNCAAGFMQIELKFDEPFYGIAYADFDRASACQVSGRGNLTARLDLPLKGCGTKQDPQRVFTNNIVVRFHPALEMDGDEVITIVCRYPPPVAPPPAALPEAILEPSSPILPLAPPLKGFQILLIICGILFLSLVLLGLGCSYYLLKRRRIQVVRRHPFSTGTGSEITKLTGSSLSNISMFEGLKIPRAHAAPASGSTSGSDAALISGGDTLPSDYPSESPSSAHSEVEDIDTRSLHRSVSSHGSYDNKAFIHQEASSMYSEGYGHHSETEIITAATSVVQKSLKPPPPEPKFDVQVRVKRAPPPPPTPTPPPSESEASMRMQERNLTTILEREEMIRSLPKPNIQTFTYVPELHPPPPPMKTTPPPIYSKVIRKQPAKIVEETWTQEDTVDMIRRRPSLTSLNTEMTDTRSMSEIVEQTHQKRAPPPPPIAPAQMYTSEMEMTTTELLEPPVVVSRRPEITSHIVDDVFLRTITEKRTIEDIERHRRQVTEYHAKPQPPPPKWDVTIRNYPNPDALPSGDEGTTDWESFSETSSLSSYPTPRPERHITQHFSEMDIQQNYKSTLEVPAPDPSVKNWDVLIRVLEPTQEETTQDHQDTYRVEQTLTLDDRRKWREIITTESTLRTLLTEATIKEDYERIRKDQRYEKLFEPQKWDVIIRVLAPPEKPQFDQKGAPGNNRYRRKADWDTRSRRSSLPTLYEYDSDGGSSVRTLTADVNGPPGVDPIMRSRRTSRSSMRSDGMDVRSMSEVTVDFAQRNMPDNMSDASSYYRPRSYYDDDDLLRPRHVSEDEDGVSLVRSVSQPSLARSASEFTEHWGVRGRPWDLSSPEHSPRSARSQRVGGATVSSYSVRQTSYQQSQGWFGDADSEASYK
uniref:ZP domain-containing protein n=1 Tax=Cuerna arida TaxID=1464854 RepID=A0A1B6H0M5_9HEMI